MGARKQNGHGTPGQAERNSPEKRIWTTLLFAERIPTFERDCDKPTVQLLVR